VADGTGEFDPGASAKEDTGLSGTGTPDRRRD